MREFPVHIRTFVSNFLPSSNFLVMTELPFPWSNFLPVIKRLGSGPWAREGPWGPWGPWEPVGARGGPCARGPVGPVGPVGLVGVGGTNPKKIII